MMRAPGTGPWTARAFRPWWRSSSARPAAATGVVGQQRHGGPGAGHDAGDGAARFAQPERVAQARRQFNGGPLQVVDQDPAEGVGVPAAQRRQDRWDPRPTGSSTGNAFGVRAAGPGCGRPPGWAARSRP